jgi:Transposase family tnp2
MYQFESLNTTKRNRPKVPCHCKKCNGTLVDPRTKQSHTIKYKPIDLGNVTLHRDDVVNQEHVSTINNEATQSFFLDDKATNIHDEITDTLDLMDTLDTIDIIDTINITDEDEEMDEEMDPVNEKIFLTKKNPTIQDTLLTQKAKECLVAPDIFSNDEESDDNDDNETNLTEDDVSNDSNVEIEDNSCSDSEYEGINFNSDDFEKNDFDLPTIDPNYQFRWIILWILQFQRQYKISDLAINSLFKFLRFLLITIDENTFFSIPTSLYTAKKMLGLFSKQYNYAACSKCHKLYTIKEIREFENNKDNNNNNIPLCSFINFPNHSIAKFRQQCNNPILKKIDTNNGPIFRPIMTFSLINIKYELSLIFSRKNFEASCRSWAVERENNTDSMFDIYDGNVWKEFLDHNSEIFFTKEYADSHIGLMLNLDWFQPFINSQYSVGVIYAVICNLPRKERFKPSNIITLAIIPGPHEPKLHAFNHYLYPIINQLLELWSGYMIKTFEYPTGRLIKGAVICCANDVPAARKLCGFISARVACYRCKKTANYKDKRPNFGEFENFEEWFVARDINIIREKANEWKECTTEDSRRNHVSQHFVRWSEIYRLPYFNPVRFCIVDPMHCLFLGVAKWIVEKLWIEGGILDNDKLKIMQEQANKIEIASNLGRRPTRINTGDGFSNYTADMWKTFILIYAIPITWDFLTDIDRKILINFVYACKILINRQLKKNELNEAFIKLLEMNKLIEKNYGPEKISPNLHLCLHICECAIDYGPLSSFWCYSFERMNGVLGKYT